MVESAGTTHKAKGKSFGIPDVAPGDDMLRQCCGLRAVFTSTLWSQVSCIHPILPHQALLALRPGGRIWTETRVKRFDAVFGDDVALLRLSWWLKYSVSLVRSCSANCAGMPNSVDLPSSSSAPPVRPWRWEFDVGGGCFAAGEW